MPFDPGTYAFQRFLRERAAALLRREPSAPGRRHLLPPHHRGPGGAWIDSGRPDSHSHHPHPRRPYRRPSDPPQALRRPGVSPRGRRPGDLAWRLPAAEDRLQTLDTVSGAQTVGDFAVTAFPTSHDAPGACGFRLDTEDGAVGVLTDTGCVTDEARSSCPAWTWLCWRPTTMWRPCVPAPYPYALKQRILGCRGHLSNATRGSSPPFWRRTAPRRSFWPT